jgi:formylglycine-generating enzyme required for sulfatase activity
MTIHTLAHSAGIETYPLQEFTFEVVTVDTFGVITARQTHNAKQYGENLSEGVSLDMVVIPGGNFFMGTRQGKGYDDEIPQHRVSVPSFLLSKVPVTQEQWQTVMDWNPPYRCIGNRRPVDRVSWHDAIEFCVHLSEKTGRQYRLPSEAEWEYACRGGTSTPFNVGKTITTDIANYVGEHTFASEPKGIYRHVTTDVGSFPPNAYGLYDMHGNVWEWCADAWHDNYVGAPTDGRAWESGEHDLRVLRGGCWHDPPDLCRSAARLKAMSRENEDYFSFRVALSSLDRTHTSTDRHQHPLRSITRHVRTWFHH